MHNGQQPITHRNLGKCQGKPQCGETQWEREKSYYFALGKFRTTSITLFQPREIPLTAQNCPPQICLENCATVRTVVRICWNLTPWNSCHNKLLYLLFCTVVLLQKILQGCLKNHAQSSLNFCASRMMLYGLYGSVQYGLSQQITLLQIKTKKSSLGFVPYLSWESCPSWCSLSSLKQSLNFSSRLLRCVFLTSLSMYMYFSLFPRNPNLHNQLNLMAIISLIWGLIFNAPH